MVTTETPAASDAMAEALTPTFYRKPPTQATPAEAQAAEKAAGEKARAEAGRTADEIYAALVRSRTDSAGVAYRWEVYPSTALRCGGCFAPWHETMGEIDDRLQAVSRDITADLAKTRDHAYAKQLADDALCALVAANRTVARGKLLCAACEGKQAAQQAHFEAVAAPQAMAVTARLVAQNRRASAAFLAAKEGN